MIKPAPCPPINSACLPNVAPLIRGVCTLQYLPVCHSADCDPFVTKRTANRSSQCGLRPVGRMADRALWRAAGRGPTFRPTLRRPQQLPEQRDDLLDLPNVIRNPGAHSRGARVGVCQGLVRSGEVAEPEVQSRGRRDVLQPPAEGVGEPREPAHPHFHR
jgi:hypothetical protein